MSVLIDPYMFELSNEQEIRDNITFFMNVIKIASYPEKSKRICLNSQAFRSLLFLMWNAENLQQKLKKQYGLFIQNKRFRRTAYL